MVTRSDQTSSMRTESPSVTFQMWRRLLCISAFAIAMGLFEAVCVIYLRRLIAPAGFDASEPPAALARFPVELIREACTLIMLGTVAWVAAFDRRSRVTAFFFMFGIWDIMYYVGLKWLAQWPSAWLEWDCLFLIPKPWYGPVLAPILISCYFMFAHVLLLARERCNRTFRLSGRVILFQLLAFVVWYWSFVKDSDRIAAQGYSAVSYSWLLFVCGLIIGLFGLWLATRPERTPAPVPSEESGP